jgi:hypothetical protein
MHWRGVALEVARRLARGRLPPLHLGIVTARVERLAVGRKRVAADQGRMFFRTGLREYKSMRPGITLRQALEATGEEGGVNLLIDPRVEKKLRVRVTVRLPFTPTETALELLADLAGLGVVKGVAKLSGGRRADF